jgi:hypothetical protein
MMRSTLSALTMTLVASAGAFAGEAVKGDYAEVNGMRMYY